MNLAIFALTKNGVKLAKSLSKKIDASLFATPKDFRKSVRNAFKNYGGLVFIMASGIVVRTIAPLLKNKAIDSAVVVMDEKGKNVISLLSGHLGGANELAKRIAKIIGTRAVITTATDVNDLLCIEDIAEKFNLVIEDVRKIKAVNSAIVNGRKVIFVDENIKRLKEIKEFVGSRVQGFKFCKSISQAQKFKADVNVIITHNSELRTPNSKLFLLRPKDLVVGIGCDRGARLKEIETAYFKALKKFNLSPLSVRNLASIDVKKDEAGLLKFAKKHKLKIDFYSKNQLAKMPLPSGFSDFVMAKVGVGGVCEPAAIKSAGVNLSLYALNREKILAKKQKVGRVTIAAAEIKF